VDEGSNYYLDTFLAPKNLGLKVGCFTENIYFNHSPVTIYKITGYVEESSETNFIDLTEIKSKFQSDVLVEFPSSRTIGNLITKLFHDVKIKPGRCKDNWAKSTQRYYGLSWCKELFFPEILTWIYIITQKYKLLKVN
jgi:hypothetical protein